MTRMPATVGATAAAQRAGSPPARRPGPPRIALLVGTSKSWGRRIARGVHGYCQANTPWSLWIEERGDEMPMRLPRGFRGEGVIARIADAETAAHLAAAGLPVVNVSAIEIPGCDFPRVTHDLDAAGTLAVDHFTERGFEALAYFGPPRHDYVRRHAAAFSRAAADRGLHVHVCPDLGSPQRSWEAWASRVAGWLAGLPKPVGILAWASRSARHLLDIAVDTGCLVPDEVAILAGDDDELTCTLSMPALSSSPFPAEQIGREAARILAAVLAGSPPPAQPTRIAPPGIVTRGSTDLLAIEDGPLRDAIRFLRDRACDPIGVPDVVAASGLDRRALERRVSRLLGRGIAEEIRRQRVARAKELLRSGDLPLPKIARLTALGSPEHMNAVFRRMVGLSPLAYRRSMRAT